MIWMHWQNTFPFVPVCIPAAQAPRAAAQTLTRLPSALVCLRWATCIRHDAVCHKILLHFFSCSYTAYATNTYLRASSSGKNLLQAHTDSRPGAACVLVHRPRLQLTAALGKKAQHAVSDSADREDGSAGDSPVPSSETQSALTAWRKYTARCVTLCHALSTFHFSLDAWARCCQWHARL